MSDSDTTHDLILGLDTVTPIQAIALIDGDEVLDACKRRVDYDHSSSLLSNIRGFLEARDLEVGDLAGLSVGIGPGSFTGARIGLAVAKALARGADVPLVGVSSLACLAYPHAATHPGDDVCAAWDARREEVYTGTYRWNGETETLETVDDDRIGQPDDMRETFRCRGDEGRDTWVVGNGVQTFDALGDDGHDRVHPMPAWAQGPSGVAAARLGRQRLRTQGPDSVAELVPNYIRPSSAEENRRAEEEDEER